MESGQYEVVWTKRSLSQLKKAFEYINRDSPQNAARVIDEIAAAVNKAAFNPEIYSPDKYKTGNDGSYRAFELHRYRISYRFSGKIIRILRVRHSSRYPLNH